MGAKNNNFTNQKSRNSVRSISLILKKIKLPGTAFTISKAENGEEALKIIHNENIQLVISEVYTTLMDGITMCKGDQIQFGNQSYYDDLLTAKNSLKSQIDGL